MFSDKPVLGDGSDSSPLSALSPAELWGLYTGISTSLDVLTSSFNVPALDIPIAQIVERCEKPLRAALADIAAEAERRDPVDALQAQYLGMVTTHMNVIRCANYQGAVQALERARVMQDRAWRRN